MPMTCNYSSNVLDLMPNSTAGLDLIKCPNTPINLAIGADFTTLSYGAEILAPYLLLKPGQIWPISADSAPFLVSLWMVLALILWKLAFGSKALPALEAYQRRRREERLKNLENMVMMEELRLSDHGIAALDLDKDQASGMEKPPSVEYIFNMIFDEVEEEPVSVAVGISATNVWYLRAVSLFKHRVAIELAEATQYTRTAQNRAARPVGEHVTCEEQMIADHQDGEKLAKLIEFTEEKAIKWFGAHRSAAIEGEDDAVVRLPHFEQAYGADARGDLRLLGADRAVRLADARGVLSQVRAAQRSGLLYILDLLRPVAPTYFCGVFFMLCARAFEAPLWASALPSYKSSVAMINPKAEEGEFGFGPQIMEVALGHCVLFCVGFLFSRPIEVLADSFGDRAAKQFSHPLRRAVMRAIMIQDTEYFDSITSAELQERLNRDTNELVENMLWIPRLTIQYLFRVIQRMLTLLFVAPRMLYACLYFNVPAFALVILSTSPLLHRLYGKRDRFNDISSAETLEVLQKIKTVRQFSMERKEQEKYSNNNLSRGVYESRINILQSLTHTMRHTMHMAGEIFVIYIALSLAVSGEAEVHDAIVGSTVGMWLQHDMKNLLEQIPKLIKVMKPVRRVASLLASKPHIEQNPDQPDPRLLRPNTFKGRIDFQRVCFSYPNQRQKQVLDGLSFSAEPGQKVAFVGKAGCGKSTAIDLLQRLYNRTGGEIRIDGRLIEEYDTNHLRSHCGVVAQQNTLFDRSIYENIVYGMNEPPGPDSEAFLEVCRKAEAWEFISKFPNKQYTFVGEKGVKLSGGQKQRIAIARVIIRKPTFLLLDEATASLDAINEQSVQSALDEMLSEHNGVALVVAHRLTTICNCDKIIVVGDNGTRIEEGTHDELMQIPKRVDEAGKPVVGPGLYHTLWDTQQVTTTVSDDKSATAALQKELADSRFELSQALEEIARLKHSATGITTPPPTAIHVR